ncbi:HypC/HybG/HupF family hydrogenase formation chaperone [Actinomycetospora sp. TBRC 11914]|uniref:HypC/HybG/HupF family hydrogenase formation chaperone n=1 Tax=Actinomycetospora sp. TBRC 11914 TaxID=2729387 RepID=UPI00145D0A77|nr:HypC/HybG/HupF family hydrogenase formation chaperone [Actinomycetospora sp. TBRC 11914]NMO91322.1 HypC/HybG/HupF family hydrogenase formation chaperone [Actinomycetospora sp. TBRC 11914]
MCLGIPGELVELPDDDTDLALVTVSGVRRKVNLGLLRGEEDLAVGDWVLIHVGFALAKIDEEEADAALRTLRQLGPAYDQELQDFATTDVG